MTQKPKNNKSTQNDFLSRSVVQVALLARTVSFRDILTITVHRHCWVSFLHGQTTIDLVRHPGLCHCWRESPTLIMGTDPLGGVLELLLLLNLFSERRVDAGKSRKLQNKAKIHI